jgi:acid phosphatase type 7
MRLRPAIAPAALALTAALALAAAPALLSSCQDTSNSAVAAAAPVKIAGTKCTYDVAPRAEYQSVVSFSSEAEVAAAVTAADPKIRRVRLGLGGSVDPGSPTHVDPSTTVAIAWQTELGTTASTVQYGTDPDPAKWKAEDTAQGFTYIVPGDPKAIGGSDQQVHETHVCGLTADTTYYYRVGGGPTGGEVWSDVISFRTLPDPGSDKEVKIAVTGDSRGQHDNAWQILEERLYKRGDLHMQLFSGDMVDLAINQGEYESWLDNSERDTQGNRSLSGQLLSLSAMGNHDNYNIQYYATVVQPQDLKAYDKYQELFFSFDTGPVHVVVLDDFAVGRPQLDQDYASTLIAWLKKDLGAVDRKAQPWVIAVHHHPEWSSSNHGNDKDVVQVRNTLSPVWDEFNVSMVFTGHDHNYERSRPTRIDNGQPSIGTGTTYIVCAGSGAEGYTNGTGPTTASSYKYDSSSALGAYGILTATRASLHFEAYGLTASGADDKIDEVTLTP